METYRFSSGWNIWHPTEHVWEKRISEKKRGKIQSLWSVFQCTEINTWSCSSISNWWWPGCRRIQTILITKHLFRKSTEIIWRNFDKFEKHGIQTMLCISLAASNFKLKRTKDILLFLKLSIKFNSEEIFLEWV